jgi:hypothetical protein
MIRVYENAREEGKTQKNTTPRGGGGTKTVSSGVFVSYVHSSKCSFI